MINTKAHPEVVSCCDRGIALYSELVWRAQWPWPTAIGSTSLIVCSESYFV